MPEWTWTEGRVEDASEVLGQGPRGTFNPKTLELVLNPNANLSTFFHETGHFFLEVMADIASQPNAPAQIAEDMNTFLKWAGIADLQTWSALDQGCWLRVKVAWSSKPITSRHCFRRRDFLVSRHKN
jgi:hypothetical protein